MAPRELALPLHSLPPILDNVPQTPMSSCSKGSRGLSVQPRVLGIFTETTVSPDPSKRQRPSRCAIRAGRNLPDKEFRSGLIRTCPFRTCRTEQHFLGCCSLHVAMQRGPSHRPKSHRTSGVWSLGIPVALADGSFLLIVRTRRVVTAAKRRVARDTRSFQHIARCAPRCYQHGGQRTTLGSYPHVAVRTGPYLHPEEGMSDVWPLRILEITSSSGRNRARPLLAGFVAYTFRTISARPSSLRCSLRSIISRISLKRSNVSRLQLNGTTYRSKNGITRSRRVVVDEIS